MNNIDDILIINTGGTFNKIYDEVSGKLIIPKTSKDLKKLIKKAFKSTIKIKGIIYKDSLEFLKDDRKFLLKTIKESNYQKIVIIHGTDTMDISAKFIAKNIDNKQIVFTGAMKPVSIDEAEGIANLSIALGFLNIKSKDGVYISMHGIVEKYDKIFKNRELGVFEKRS